MVFVVLVTRGAFSQSTPEPARDAASNQHSYTLTLNSKLVALDTVVRDQNGNIVRNLKKDDFTVLEDGVPQQIVAFDAVDTTKTSAMWGSIHSSEELEQKAPRAPVTILVLDELTTTFEDEYFARYSLGKYLDAQGETLGEPTMLLARTYDRTMVLHDYTTSRKEILNALNRHLVGNDWRATTPDQSANLLGAAFASLIEVAKATEGHEGHKNVIWIGRGFPTIQWDNLPAADSDALQQAVVSCSNLLRAARITLYSLDPSGIQFAQEGTLQGNGDVVQEDPLGGQVNFDSIVHFTGGLSMHGRNDVDRMIGEAVTDGELFYTLTYRPPELLPESSNTFRQIRIVMKDPQLVATTRSGYFFQAVTPLAETPQGPSVSNARDLDLAGALSGLMVYSGIPLQVIHQGETNRYRLSLPAESLGLAEADGRLTGEIDLIVVSFDRAGKVLDRSGKVIALHFPVSPPGRVESRTVTLAVDSGAAANPARVRFVVRSHTNGRIGTENYFLVDRDSLKDPSAGLKAAKPGTK